jgi:hypothetical protein
MFSFSLSYKVKDSSLESKDSSDQKNEKDDGILGYNYQWELGSVFPFFKSSVSEVKVGD